MFVRFFIILITTFFLLCCGDNDSKNSLVRPVIEESSSSIEIETSSSSEESSSSATHSSSSEESSSSATHSSSSEENSSSATHSSSSEESSSSATHSSSSEESSSSATHSSSSEESSSSVTHSSSSEESSSSATHSSSSEESSSSVTHSSSSEESSSSVTHSSSSEESSSSEAHSSSSLNSVYDAMNNTLADLRDGRVYKTVTIGSQIWMAENLNYLPEDTIGTIWAGKSLCGGGEWHTNMEGDCRVYGRLYEEDFTKQTEYIQKICPNGWSLPTITQYQILIAFLGDNAVNKMKMEESSYWKLDDIADNSGFSAIPAGYFSPLGYNNMHDEGISVASFAFLSDGSKARNAITIIEGRTDFGWSSFGDGYYMSVRCIKD